MIHKELSDFDEDHPAKPGEIEIEMEIKRQFDELAETGTWDPRNIPNYREPLMFKDDDDDEIGRENLS